MEQRDTWGYTRESRYVQVCAMVKLQSLLMAQMNTEKIGAILMESAYAYVKLPHQWMGNVMWSVIMDTISTNSQVRL